MALEKPNLDMDNIKEPSDGNIEDGNNPNLAGDDNNSEEDSQGNEVDNEGSEEEEEEALDKSLLRQNSSDILDDPSQFYFDDDLPTPDLSNHSNENSNDLISSQGLITNENSNDLISSQGLNTNENSNDVISSQGLNTNENSNDLISSQGLNTNENSNEAAALERGTVDDDSDDKLDDEPLTDLLDKQDDDVMGSEGDEELAESEEESPEKEDGILEDSEYEEDEEQSDTEENNLTNETQSDDEGRDIEESNESEHENSDKSHDKDLKQDGEDDDDDGSIIMDEYEDDFEEEEAEGEEEEEKEEEEEREELSIDEEGEKSLDNSEEENEEEALEVEESLDEDEKEDMENRVDSKAESDREKGEEENEESLENVEDKREKIEDNVEKSEGQVKDQIEDFAGKEMVANDLNTCDNRDTGAVIDKNLEISCKEDTKVTKAKSEEVDKETHGQSEIKSLNHETNSLINTMEDIKDEPKAESAKSPRRLRSSQTRIENRKADVTNDVNTEKSTNNNPGNIKQELPDTCAGLQVSKLELDRIRLKKDLLQSRINTLDKFLDPSIKSKEWRQGEEGEDEKLTEIRKRRPKQRRLTETEVMQRLGTKRKRSEDGVAVEDNVSVVKSDGRGRPKGWRKVKEEVVDDSVDKPIVKRRKKEELLLMKALDEEMLKMDEDNTKEMERISQGLDYQCSVCSQVFIEKINLSKHFFKCLMKFTQSGRSSFKCAICFEYFSLLESLEAHVSRKHDGICEEPFQCSVCSLCFEEGSALKGHVLDKHDVFQCWLCSKYYRNQHTLDIHLAKKHPGESRDRKPIERKGNSTNIPTVTPGNTVITSGNTTNIATTTTGNTVTFTRNTRGKGSVANIIKQEPTEHVKIEPPSTSQPNANEPRKKLGRPFKRNLSEDQYTGTQPVLQKKKLIENQYTGAQPVLQTEGQVHSKPQLPNSEPTPAAGATTPETGTKTDDKIPPVTPEENSDELGRGRRVKKKKALDYEDSISTTPGRRVNRKSADGGQIGQLTYGRMGSGQTCSSQGTLGGQLVEASCSNGLTIHGSHQMTDLKTNNPNDGRFVRNRNSIRNHQMPQPRILHPQPMPLPRVIQPHSISVQKVNNMRAEKCSKGTNTSSNRESLPVWKVFPSSDLSTSKNNSTSNNASTSETLSQSVADDVSTGDPSEQPIQQAVESSVYLNRKVHLCPKCRKPFPNKYLVKVHMKRRHNIFKRKTVIVPQNGAQESGETPPSGQTSERNQSRSQPLIGNRETLFKCVLCEASFPSFYSLEDHYLRVHEGIPCSVCRIRIKNRMLLDKHLNACHPPEVRYVCPVCDKRMKSKETLRKHIVMHEDRRPYDCSVCKRSFRYSYDMRLHMRRTHPKEFARMNSGNATVGEEETGGDE